MSNKYDQIMDQIEVTDEMRQRVLKNVEYACRPGMQASFALKDLLKWVFPIAACFVLIWGLIYLPLEKGHTDVRPQVTNQIVQANSLQELSDMVGFEVAGISDLPFDAQTVTYKSYWNQMAETKYIGDTNTCILRQSTGTQDISGDYTQYAYQEKRVVNGVEVLLKGNSSDSFLIAVWCHDDFAFAVAFTEGIPFDAYETVIGAILK